MEAMSIEEPLNELTLLATGNLWARIPNQHGAAIRLVVTWKYSFKGVKYIAKIEFTDKQLATFWNTLVPRSMDSSPT